MQDELQYQKKCVLSSSQVNVKHTFALHQNRTNVLYSPAIRSKQNEYNFHKCKIIERQVLTTAIS